MKNFLSTLIFSAIIYITAQSQQVYMYANDFTYNTDATGWTTYGGNWGFEQPDANQGYKAYSLNSTAYDKSVVTVPQATDFVLEADLEIIDGGQASLIFCVANPSVGGDNFQGYSAGIDASGQVWLSKHNNNWTSLGSVATSIIINTPYNFRVIKKGSNIRVVLNGIEKINITDATYSSCNKVGIRGGVNNHIWAKNFYYKNDIVPVMPDEFVYTNTIPHTLIRDSQIIKEGDTYYMTGTGSPFFFKNNPGVRLWSSKDLINWKFECLLIERSPANAYRERFWAPEIHKINNKFYLTFNCFFPADAGNPPSTFIATADKITGPYTVFHPTTPVVQGGNDGNLFQDEDGKNYILTSGIYCSEIDLTTGNRIGNTWQVISTGVQGEWDGGSGVGIEGPYLIKRNGVYYLFYSSWARGYEVGVATATNIHGPWTKSANNPIWGGQDQAACDRSGTTYTQNPNVPYKEVGHNAIFTGPDGRDWLCAHGFYGPAPGLVIDPIWFENGQVRTTANPPEKPDGGPTWTKQTIYLSPLVHLPFNEGTGTTTKDAGNYNNNGVLNNGIAWGSGAYNTAGSSVILDGIDDYITVPNTSLMNNLQHSFTISAFIKADNFINWGGIVSKGTNTTGSTPFSLTTWSDGTVRFIANVGALTGAVGTGMWNSKGKLTTGIWNYVAVTYDGTTLKFYINGNLDSEVGIHMTLGLNNEPIVIGCDFFGGDEYFKGSIDEVSVYSRVLSANEIQAINQDEITNINNISNEDLFIYPNPASNQLIINNSELRINEIIIADMQGLIIYTCKDSFVGSKTIDLSDVTNGMYFITIWGNNINQTKKIMILK